MRLEHIMSRDGAAATKIGYVYLLCLFVCLQYLLVCLSVYLLVCLSVLNLSVRVRVYEYLYVFILVCLSAC